MSRLLVVIVVLIGSVTLVASVGSLVVGIPVFLKGLGSSGLGGAIGTAFGLLLVGAGAVLLVPGVLLVRAARALRAAAPGLPATTPRSRLVSGGVALLAGFAFLAPIALGAGPGVDPTFITIASVVGATVCVTAAWTARYFPGQALGRGLLLVALLGAGLGGWVTLRALGESASVVLPLDPADERTDQVRNGVTIAAIAHDIGSVGTWIPIAGGTLPMVAGDDWSTSPNEVLAELRGESARFALVGQCWIDREDGNLTADLHVAAGPSVDEPRPRQLSLSPVRCDGLIHTTVSVELALPAWLDPSVPNIARQPWFSAGVATTSPADANGTPARRVHRWLVYVSPEPASPVEDVERAVAEFFDPLR